MEALQEQLAQLSPAQVAALLGASGHAQLLQAREQPEETRARAEAARQRGNERFREGDFAHALTEYSVLSNRAAARLKLRDFRGAVEDCTLAIEVAPAIKPFMRRAAARVELQEFNDAVRDLVAALAFEPDNKECVSKLSAIARLHSPAAAVGRSTAVDRRTIIAAALAVAARGGWKPVAVKGNPAPPALNGHSLFRGAGGTVFLFGGRAVRDQQTQVFALDERDFSWDVATVTGTGPSPRAWHSVTCIDELSASLCVYGGVSSQGEDPRVHILTTARGNRVRWTQPESVVGDAPSARSGHSAVSVAVAATAGRAGTQTFVFGGRTKRGVSDAMFILRSSANGAGVACAWEEVPRTGPWPAARDGHTMCALPAADDGAAGRKLLLFGGNGQQNDDKMNDTWVFDTRSRRWEEVQCVGAPPPRSYHTAHIVGSCMWFDVPVPELSRLAARAWHASILTATHQLFVLGGGTFNGPRKDAALLDLSALVALVPLPGRDDSAV
ncbi:hypothetical protein PybrP1_004645 [[Pythium] brassicae (nom. inval.)]|nr:hypothetical protein PybrP1_004645 [[Pythium] brassicae (nom. inval.)]